MDKMLEFLYDLAETKVKIELCLAMIAGGDSPERVGERLGWGSEVVNTIIRLDMSSRARRGIR